MDLVKGEWFDLYILTMYNFGFKNNQSNNVYNQKK